MSGYGFRPDLDLNDPSRLSYAPSAPWGQPPVGPGYLPGQPPVGPGCLPGQPPVGPGCLPGQPPVGPGYLPGAPHMETHNDGYYWVNSNSFSQVPDHAVRGGVDSDGSAIYVGRAFINGDFCPAKVVASRGQAYVAHDGTEHCVSSYDVLCEQRFEWVPSYGGQVPPNAVCGGQTGDGERLYIGRTYHEGSNTVGKVHPSHNCLYIPYGGEELRFDSYEILIRM